MTVKHLEQHDELVLKELTWGLDSAGNLPVEVKDAILKCVVAAQHRVRKRPATVFAIER